MNLDRLFQAGIGIALLGIALTFWPSPAGGYYCYPKHTHEFPMKRSGTEVTDLGHIGHGYGGGKVILQPLLKSLHPSAFGPQEYKRPAGSRGTGEE
jgi:hypothetical protein